MSKQKYVKACSKSNSLHFALKSHEQIYKGYLKIPQAIKYSEDQISRF